MPFRMLDCFCGLGGASEGFHREGFDCTGIDIVNVGYPYKFIQADMLTLNGADYQGYDVIWGSPPCREFSSFARFARERKKRNQPGQWKKQPNIECGLELVRGFLRFIHGARPKMWIMENVPGLEEYLFLSPPVIVKARIGKTMVRSFWGKFPHFLMPLDERKKPIQKVKQTKLRSWERAKIPLACSLAFARACKSALESGYAKYFWCGRIREFEPSGDGLTRRLTEIGVCLSC